MKRGNDTSLITNKLIKTLIAISIEKCNEITLCVNDGKTVTLTFSENFACNIFVINRTKKGLGHNFVF